MGNLTTASQISLPTTQNVLLKIYTSSRSSNSTVKNNPHIQINQTILHPPQPQLPRHHPANIPIQNPPPLLNPQTYLPPHIIPPPLLRQILCRLNNRRDPKPIRRSRRRRRRACMRKRTGKLRGRSWIS